MSEIIHHNGTISGTVNNTDTTETSSSSTGCMTLAGGLGVAKKIFLGSDLIMSDGSSNTITLTTPSISSNYTLTLPVDSGSSGEVLTTNGSGVMTWESASTPLVSGTVTQSTSITTTVVLNAQVGVITTQSTSIGWGNGVEFTFTNSYITTSSILLLSVTGAFQAPRVVSFRLLSNGFVKLILASTTSSTGGTFSSDIHFRVI